MQEQKKTYEIPEVEIIHVSESDILTISASAGTSSAGEEGY